MASVETQAILLVHGPDRKGIVAAFSQTLFGHGCGIVSSEQHTDVESSVFYQPREHSSRQLHAIDAPPPRNAGTRYETSRRRLTPI